MTGLLKQLYRGIDQHCILKGQLKKEGCRVLMTNAPSSRLTIDLDKDGSPLSRQSSRCDYLIVAESHDGSGWLVLLELKSGMMEADLVIKQLKASAIATENIIPKHENCRFRPVVAFGRVSKYERNIIKNATSKISFHGCKESIRMMKCGTLLKNVVDW